MADLLVATSTSSAVDPLISGGAIAVLAFGLATAREIYVRRREGGRRQRLSLRAFVHEMDANREACGNNLTLIAVEKGDLANGSAKGLLHPLSRLESGSWAVARTDLPTSILEDQDLVRRLHTIHRNTHDINSIVQSRESFRIQHLRDNDLLLEGLGKYGAILTHLLGDLRDRIDEAGRELDAYL